MFISRKYIGILFILCIFFFACGYRFSGEGGLPYGIKRICITILENRTAETGAENIFTNDLIYEFSRKKNIVLSERDKADAVLGGVIKSIRIETISRKRAHTSLERRVKATVDLDLKGPNGEIIWSAKDVSANEAYAVVSDKQLTEQYKRTAISELSKRLAENVYNRLTEDF